MKIINYKILVFDSCEYTLRSLRKNFENRGWITHISSSLPKILSMALSETYDLCICELKNSTSPLSHQIVSFFKQIHIPIIFVSESYSFELEEFCLLHADDFVPKHRGHKILATRAEKVLTPPQLEQMTQCSKLNVCFTDECIVINDNKIKMSKLERQIFSLLLKNHGGSLSRDEISINLKGFSYGKETRSYDLVISRMRKKLSGVKGLKIKTIRSVGYQLIIDKSSKEK